MKKITHEIYGDVYACEAERFVGPDGSIWTIRFDMSGEVHVNLSDRRSSSIAILPVAGNAIKLRPVIHNLWPQK